MEKKTLLIIDDDVDICMLLKRFFERNQFRVRIAFKGTEGIEIFKKEEIDLILTDFRLPDKDGFEMVKELRGISKDVPVIVITGYSDVNQAVQLIRLGAYEYVTKPIYPEEILTLVQDALKKKELQEETQKKDLKAKTSKESEVVEQNFFPKTEKTQELLEKISLVGPTMLTVLIQGETGTGKEVIARMLHDASDRKDQAFIPVDCGALTQELAASELFGHVKGAFTGALSDKKGSIELANGGTLFLDEIGNLSYENQVKLLRALQERVIQRVGSEKTTSIDVRFIAATNEDLDLAIKEGAFRSDIYYRINEFKLELLPLRYQKETLEAYFNFFLKKANKKLQKNITNVSKDAWTFIENYSWPGNLRELKNTVNHAVLLAEGGQIEIKDLPQDVIDSKQDIEKLNAEKGNSLLLKEITKNAETWAIQRALKLARNNKSKAAEMLGIDRKTLYNKLEAYNLTDIDK